MTAPRVLVVRSEQRAGSLADRLEALGLEVVLCPLIATERLGEEPIPVGGYDWLIVTSPNAAEELLRRGLAGAPQQIAAIGPGTAGVLAAAGISADLVPETSTQEGLLEAFPRTAGRVVIAAAEGARRVLADELGADVVPLYRTVELELPSSPPAAELAALASSSQARAFAKLRLDLPVVSIGPQTTATARAEGLRVVAEAEPHDLDGLVAAVGRFACG